MEKEAAVPLAEKRTEEPEEPTSTLSPHELSAAAADAPPLEPKSRGQEPPPGEGGEEEEGIDRISRLPDAILGEIICLLPTTDAAPLNLDHIGLPNVNQDIQAPLVGLISRILAAHPGPARRFSTPVVHLYLRPATVTSWLRSPALDNLQELEFVFGRFLYDSAPQLSLPAPVFRFSATLRVLTISKCHLLDGEVESLHFTKLRRLGLETVQISEGSLHSMIAGCSVLECLLLKNCYGFRRINSPSLRSICYGVHSAVGLIIGDAPSLERLLPLEHSNGGLFVTVISAPKLETFGGLSDGGHYSKFAFGTTVIKGLRPVSFTKVVCSVKILGVDTYKLSLDAVINLMRCFPCLEKLYIQTSNVSGGNNLWRHKHCDSIRCLDICLKMVVLKNYRGIQSQVNFATFFILNAKMLELMRFEGGACSGNEKFIAEQQRLLQLKKRASRGAQFDFTSRCHYHLLHIKNVHDLSKANPFECTCCDMA